MFVDFGLRCGYYCCFFSLLIVTAFANSYTFQLVVFIYFYVTNILKTTQLLCKFYLQNKIEQDRTEQNIQQNKTTEWNITTEQNRTTEQNIQQNRTIEQNITTEQNKRAEEVFDF